MSPTHRRPAHRGRRVVLALAGTVVVVLGAFVVIARLPATSTAHTSADAATTTPSTAPTLPAVASSPPPPVVPLHLVSITPTAAATSIEASTPIVVTFDAPVANSSALPSISPDLPGTWTRPAPAILEFTPLVPFEPDTTVTISVPADVRAVDGSVLGTPVASTYRVADGTLLRLQQLLAELDYLPVSFTPQAPEIETLAAQTAAAYAPVAGTFAMRFASTPATLQSLWVAGVDTVLTRGAVMAFEHRHGLKVDGAAGPAVWAALISAALAGETDPEPYTWAWATTTKPETLQIWSGGSVVFSSLANTGIPAAPTPKGSWPVFLRYLSQTMQGTNPNGTKYKDVGVPYVNYFNGGDAIHGFLRGSYGTQQSLGCVELPYSAAKTVWGLIDYGTVVTVS